MLNQRLDYVHTKPVEAGFVKEPELWEWSSARSYAGTEKGKIDLIFIE